MHSDENILKPFIQGYIVHEYKVSIKDENEKEVYRDNFIATYFVTDDFFPWAGDYHMNYNYEAQTPIFLQVQESV